MKRPFFDRLVWHDDRVFLDDLVFRLEQRSGADWDLGEHCFRFYKGRALLDQYEGYWAQHGDFCPQSILELGMWDGGSVAFWYEFFQPQKHVGVDIEERPDSEYFEQFVRSRKLEERVKTFWGVDQGDADALRNIVATEFPDPLDLVLDDASHLYELTKASFETLFPLLRPGGLYVIEDWAWGHWKSFQSPDHAWAAMPALTALVAELIEAVGSGTTLITSATIFQGFAVFERGHAEFDKADDFRLADHIVRRPGPRKLSGRARRRLRAILGR